MFAVSISHLTVWPKQLNINLCHFYSVLTLWSPVKYSYLSGTDEKQTGLEQTKADCREWQLLLQVTTTCPLKCAHEHYITKGNNPSIFPPGFQVFHIPMPAIRVRQPQTGDHPSLISLLHLKTVPRKGPGQSFLHFPYQPKEELTFHPQLGWKSPPFPKQPVTESPLASAPLHQRRR